MKSTINDMWQMVWETGSNRIVMFAEKDKEGKVKITYAIHAMFYTIFMSLNNTSTQVSRYPYMPIA